jgi:hypothetical protein
MVSLAKARLSIRPEIGLKPVNYVYVEPGSIIVDTLDIHGQKEKYILKHSYLDQI